MVDTKKLRERLKLAFDELEEARVGYLAERSRRRMWAGAIVPVGILGCLWIAFLLRDGEVAVTLIFGVIIGTAYWTQAPSRVYRRRYKELVIPHIAKELGDFRFQSQGGISIDSIRSSRIIPKHHHYMTEDYIRGSYLDVGIEFCEARMMKQRWSRRDRIPETVFCGLVIFLKMNKPFAGHTIVRRERNSDSPFIPFSGLERVKLEDPHFERIFKVHGTDQIEARRLLTPATMERLKSLTDVVGAHSMECAFFNNHLLVLMPHSGAMTHYGPASPLGGFLEPGPLDFPVTQHDSISKIAREFESICNLVTELKLHEDHGV